MFNPFPTTVAYTIPVNGAISGSSSLRTATSQFYLQTPPASSGWSANIQLYAANAAGCLASTPSTVGTIAVSTSAVTTITISSPVSVPIGACVGIDWPTGLLDSAANNPYGSFVVIY